MKNNTLRKVVGFFLGFAWITLHSGCGSALELKGAQVKAASVESVVTTTTAGTVMAEQQAILAFGVTGRVKSLSVQAGQAVRRGQILAQLENSDLRTALSTAQSELDRAGELYKSALVSRAALDEAKRAFDGAQANFEKTLIRAPFDGIVTEVSLELGELAQPAATASQKAPIRIVDLKPRLVRGDIDEVDLAKIQVGTPARIRIQAVGKDWIPAKVRKVIPFVSTAREKDRTSEIELSIQSPDANRIPVGASAEIELIVAAKEAAVVVPSRTLLGHGAQRYVFLFRDGKIHKEAVQTGIGNYERMEILGGLKIGDTVVFPPEEKELRDGAKAKVELVPWP